MADETPTEDAAPKERGPFFAVKTTLGEEQAVAGAIRARAQSERAPVASVLSPQTLRGYVFVEGLEFDPLTNLVGAVRHARGVVRAPGKSDPTASQIPWSDIEAILARAESDEQMPSLESLLRWDEPTRGAGPGKAAKRQQTHARKAEPKERSQATAAAGVEGRYALALNLAIALPPLALAIGLIAAPGVVWDGFLYPFFWSSIEADARGTGGAAEGYNVVNTLAYALLLVPALLFIWRVLDRIRVRVDERFVYMLTPFLLLGGAGRALEDAAYFHEPFAYAFISPLIYIAEGFLVLALVVSAYWVASTAAAKGPAQGVLAWCAAFAPGAAVIYYLGTARPTFVAVPIPAPIMISALSAAFLAGVAAVLKIRDRQPHRLVLVAGGTLLGIVAYLIVRWSALGAWGAGSPAVETHLGEAQVILTLAAVATAATMTAWWLVAPKFAWARSLLLPINGLVYFAQFLDAAATYWGIDHFGYLEKHVTSGFFIELTGTALVMFPLKLVVFTFVLYLIDVMFREDLQDADGRPGTLAGLLKLTVITLGLGPGTRDMLRLVMGV